jgi:MFS family permease
MKEKRNLTAYMIGRFISFIGTGAQQVALPLYILDLTHSGAMMALFSVLSIVPNLIAAPFAGVFLYVF